MPTLKRIFLILFLIALLLNEDFVKLAMASLANAHILLNILHTMASHLFRTYHRAVAAKLPHCVNTALTAVNHYYNQASIFAQPVLRAGTMQLTHCTAILVRHAPCVLCKFLKCAKEWTSYVSVRTIGEGMYIDGYMELQNQMVEIHEVMMYYCAAVGGCGLPNTVWRRDCA